MICPPWLAILWLGAAGVAPAWAAENATEPPSKNLAGAFILECETSQVCESVAKAVKERGGTLRHMFNSDVFTGVSVQLPQLTTEEDRRSLLSQFKGIKESWPVQEVIQVPESTAEEASNEKEEELGNKPVAPSTLGMRHSRLGRRARKDKIESPWNHVMTHVDKLHEEGFTGRGIKIAVVDTGVRRATLRFLLSLRNTDINKQNRSTTSTPHWEDALDQVARLLPERTFPTKGTKVTL